MNPRTKLVIVCSPDLDADQALDYSRAQGFIAGHWQGIDTSHFYFFPEADLGYRAYREEVSRMVEAAVKAGKLALIHTRYLEPAINGFVEVAYDVPHQTPKKCVDADQVEVHLFRVDQGWTIHHLDDRLILGDEWPFGIFYD